MEGKERRLHYCICVTSQRRHACKPTTKRCCDTIFNLIPLIRAVWLKGTCSSFIKVFFHLQIIPRQYLIRFIARSVFDQAYNDVQRTQLNFLVNQIRVICQSDVVHFAIMNCYNWSLPFAWFVLLTSQRFGNAGMLF